MTPPIHRQHPDRLTIQAEAHSRPPLAIEAANSEAWHWVLHLEPGEQHIWPATFCASARHEVREVPGGIVRFERHTEFVSLTYFGETAPSAEALEIVRTCPGKQIAGAQILLREDASLPAALEGNRLFGGRVTLGEAAITTDFIVNDNGMVVYAVSGRFADSFARGRLVKRLLDLETYRTVSLLALPLVRRETGRLEELERRANRAASALARQSEPLELAIEDLADILRAISAIKSETAYRMAASKAYFDLVNDRLEILGEDQIGQRQTLRGFVKHRLDPGIKTIGAFERRADNIAVQVSESLALVRTQLEHSSQQQSQALLASMERRVRQQVHLAQAVEGLSVAAITYYAVGLLSYLLKGAPDFALSDSAIVALAIVPIGLCVWLATKSATRHITDEGAE